MSVRPSIPALQSAESTRRDGKLYVSCRVRYCGITGRLFESEAKSGAILMAMEETGLPMVYQHSLLVEASTFVGSHEASMALTEAAEELERLLRRMAAQQHSAEEFSEVFTHTRRGRKNTTVKRKPLQEPAMTDSDGHFEAPLCDHDPFLRIEPPREAVIAYQRQPEVLRAIGDRLAAAGLLTADGARHFPQALGFTEEPPKQRLAWLGRNYELQRLIVNLKNKGWLPDGEGRGHSLWDKVCNVFYLPPKPGGELRSLMPDTLRAARCGKYGAYQKVDHAVAALFRQIG